MELDAEEAQDPPEVFKSPVSYAKWWSPFRNDEKNEAKVVTLVEEEPLEPFPGPSQSGDMIVVSVEGPYSEAEDDENPTVSGRLRGAVDSVGNWREATQSGQMTKIRRGPSKLSWSNPSQSLSQRRKTKPRKKFS